MNYLKRLIAAYESKAESYARIAAALEALCVPKKEPAPAKEKNLSLEKSTSNDLPELQGEDYPKRYHRKPELKYDRVENLAVSIANYRNCSVGEVREIAWMLREKYAKYITSMGKYRVLPREISDKIYALECSKK